MSALLVGSEPTTSDQVREAHAFRAAMAVIVLAILDDAFGRPEPGTTAGDHLVSGLVPVAIALVLGLTYARLRPGLRGAVALVCGVLAMTVGAVDGFRHVAIDTLAGDDVMVMLAGIAGLVLVALGAQTLWRTRRLAEQPLRRYGRRVSFTTPDGLRLVGWYVPSRNRAAVIAFPGRTGPVAHARMLARHGSAVLLFDRRGEGQGDGDFNAFGWGGDAGLLAVAVWLVVEPRSLSR